jgi:magnesium transporter
MEPSTVAEALEHLVPTSAARCILRWPDEKIKAVLEPLSIPHAVRMLRPMEQADRERVLNLVSKRVSQALRAGLRYPEGTAASRMTTRIPAYPRDYKVGEVWKHLRRSPQQAGSYIYIVDPDGVLVGVLSLRELIAANPRESLHSLMQSPVESLPAHVPQEMILSHSGWRHFKDLPVVDEKGVLIGLIEYSTLRQLELERSEPRPQMTLRLALALGELYWISSSDLLRGVTETIASTMPRRLTGGERDDH